MNIIAFCCALDNTYLAIKYNDSVYSEIIKSDENYHSLYLISKIKQIMSENSMGFNKIDAICVNCGQGSFTGIRVAMSVAKVIASELDLPLIPLNTSSILLSIYDKCKYLIMDARRDMYFLGTKDNTKLISKDKVCEYISESDIILADSNSSSSFKNAICFENQNINIALKMLDLAQEKFNSSENKEEFNYLNIKANYIQTPPIF